MLRFGYVERTCMTAARSPSAVRLSTPSGIGRQQPQPQPLALTVLVRELRGLCCNARMSGKRGRVRAMLASYDGPGQERVRRAIVALADGDEDELRILVEVARTDYRDVLALEEERRTGRRRPPVDIERLTAWLAQRPPPPASSAPASALPSANVVLTHAGSGQPELLKAIRAATGLGLADVAALLDQAPVAILYGVERGRAEELKAELEAAGGTVELR